jgi:N-methylhydantoinase A/oxoprolinase/acetone carboxylase beta subunit
VAYGIQLDTAELPILRSDAMDSAGNEVRAVRIGVDVGGTNTDAALMDGVRVVASTKSPTTSDIAGGIVTAIRDVLRKVRADARSIRSVMIGTTQFTNAFV